MNQLLTTVKQGTMDGNRPSAAATYGVFGLLGIILVGIFGLVALQRDISQVLYFLGPIVLVLLGLLPVISGQKKTQEKLDAIENQTNGQLNKKFDAVHTKLEALSNQVSLQASLSGKPLTGEELAANMREEGDQSGE